MKISSVVADKSIKLLSGLGNNDDSLVAMVAKDWIGDSATVYTYKKEGGKDDFREKVIEEFGTGIVWLFGIPAFKKAIEKVVYPIFKLNPDFDPRVLDSNKLENIKKLASGAEKKLFDTLDEKNLVLKKFTNAQMYKGMGVAKFAIATIGAAIGLSAIIKYKQKTTNERIARDIENRKLESQKQNYTNINFIARSEKEKELFGDFIKDKKSNQPSFTGNFANTLCEFMYNPIKNTMILDGVIAGTRLSEGRKGERLEIGFKELCQVAFTYGLAKPIQLLFEKIGDMCKTPIKLDPKVLYTNNLKQTIEASKGSINALKNSKNMIKTLSSFDVKSPIIQLLEKQGVIALSKDKSSISFFKQMDENAIKGALDDILDLDKNIENLTKARVFKPVAIIANVLITVGLLGILQPKLTILLRKALYGSNENPAIAKLEEENKNKKEQV